MKVYKKILISSFLISLSISLFASTQTIRDNDGNIIETKTITNHNTRIKPISMEDNIKVKILNSDDKENKKVIYEIQSKEKYFHYKKLKEKDRQYKLLNQKRIK